MSNFRHTPFRRQVKAGTGSSGKTGRQTIEMQAALQAVGCGPVNIAFEALLLDLLYLTRRPVRLTVQIQELPIISLSLTGRAAAAPLCAGGCHGPWFLA